MAEENNKINTEEKHEEKAETSKEIIKDIEKSGVPEKVAKKEEKLDELAEKEAIKDKKDEEEKKKEVEKKAVRGKPKPRKKTMAFVNVKNLPISTKHSVAICNFIRRKKIEDAIKDLEAVLKLRKAVPMKGEIPHRKGKGMMSGRFPKNASERFVKLLKSLSTNASHIGLEEPLIVEAVANLGERPYGRFGSVRKKRTHVMIKAKGSVEIKEKK